MNAYMTIGRCVRAMLLLLAPALAAFGDDPARTIAVDKSNWHHEKKWRHHFVLEDAKKNVLYEGTEITSLRDAQDENVVVLWDRGAGRGLRFQRSSDYEKNLSVYSVEELAGGSFFRFEMEPAPFTGRTRDAVLKEARENPKLMEVPDPSLTLVTNTIRRTVLESQWNEEANARQWRTELRSSLSPSLLESLERLRGGALHTSALMGYTAVLLDFLYHGPVAGEGSATLTQTSVPPDCRFDADMGHPCDEAQAKRVKEAAQAGQVLLAY